MPITRSIKPLAEDDVTQLKQIKSIYVASKDGKTKSKIDLTALSKVVDATLTNKGIVQLQTEINDNEANAATPKAVNTVKAIADANAQKIKEVEDSINSALPGEGTLADKLKDVAFRTKDNLFTESQTIIAKDHSGIDGANVILKTEKLTHETGAFDPGTSSVEAGISLQDKAGKNVAVNTFSVKDSGRDATLGVVDNLNQTHGITVHLDKAGDPATAVAFAPNTPEGAIGQEIVTAKFLADTLDTVQDSLVDATDKVRGLTKLSDTADETLDAATGATAVTPKALFDTEAKIKAVTDVIGEDASNAALLDAENTFVKNQNIESRVEELKAATDAGDPAIRADQAVVDFKLTDYDHLAGTIATEGVQTAEAGLEVHDKSDNAVGSVKIVRTRDGAVEGGVHISNEDGTVESAVTVKYDTTTKTFSGYAPSTADDATGNEIATADFVTAKVQGVQDNLVDATDTQRGLVILSDAIDSDLNAQGGKTAATPLAVKTVQDNLNKLTTVTGETAENVALKNAENVFVEANTFEKGIELTNKTVVKVKHDDFNYGAGSTKVGYSGILLTDREGNELANVQVGAGHTDSTNYRAAGFTLMNGNPADTKAAIGELCIKSDDGVTSYAVAPQPRIDGVRIDDEIATVKYVTDAVGNINPDNIAYINKHNVFNASQTINATSLVEGISEDGSVEVSVRSYDAAAGSFSSGAPKASGAIKLRDKNAILTAEHSLTATITSHNAAVKAYNADASDSALVEVVWDRASDTFAAYAPSTDVDADANEIATADFVLTKTGEVAEDLKAVTDVIGVNAEKAALVDKTNVFTEAQKIDVDGKILNLGGEGLASEGAADDALVFGSSFDGSKAELIIAANGSITRTELPDDPDDLEVATVGYVKALGDIGGSMETGNWSIALSNYTEEAFQAGMDEGVFYSVPFNVADQYLQIDPETGKVADTQAAGVTDKKVDHFVIMYKAPTSKLVMNLGERKMAPNFEDVPLLSGDNNFTGTNTFKDAQKASPSVDPELADVNDKSYIAKSELIAYFNKHSPWSNVVTAEPALEDMVPGQLYFVVEA